MKIIGNIFLILSILLPSLLIVFIILNRKDFKKKKRFRKRVIKLILLTFLINFSVFKVMDIINSQLNKDKPVNETNKNNTEKNSGTKHKIENIDGVTYIDGHLIVNKTYPLPENYTPQNTHIEVKNDTLNCATCINEDAYEAFENMKKDATKEKLNIWIQSGYRSYKYQEALYNNYVNKSGKAAADTYSARKGHSEHQSGLAFDLNTIDDSFANTLEGKWINDNCYKYGFIIRYPKGKENKTGYKYESWHLRYVGLELAKTLYNDGNWITMEEYFEITSAYKN